MEESTMEKGTKTSRRESKLLAGSVYLISSDGKIISLPIPSTSRRDPLNWSTWKRAGHLFSLAFFATTGFTILHGSALLVDRIEMEFAGQNLGPNGQRVLLVAPSLFVGFGAFLWVPLSLAIGRRCVFLIANAILLGSTIAAATATGFTQLVIAVSLQGLAQGVFPTVGVLTIFDLTFIHQRPVIFAFVWSVVVAMSYLILGIISQVGDVEAPWRLFYQFWTVPICISCVLAFFLFPETYFLRPAVAFDGRIVIQSATEKLEIYDDWKSASAEKELPDQPNTTWELKLMELPLWDRRYCSWRAMGHCYLQMLMCFINPSVAWVTLLSTFIFSGMISIGTTYLDVLSVEPYNMGKVNPALLYVSGAVGALLAWLASGLLTSKIIHRLAMRNGGVRDAKFYLPAYILPVFASAASLVLYGHAVEHKLHVSLIFIAFGANIFGFVSIATVNTIWLTEAFPKHAAAVVALFPGSSEIFSFLLSFSIKPWIRSQGIGKMNLQLALILMVLGCVGLPIAFWGKQIRQRVDGKWAAHEGGALRPQ